MQRILQYLTVFLKHCIFILLIPFFIFFVVDVCENVAPYPMVLQAFGPL